MAAIVVAGGGIAGLACAWRLRQRGHEVEVLERDAAPGGRMRGDSPDGWLVDRGARCAASGFRNLHALASATGLADRARRVARAGTAVLREGVLHPGDYASARQLLCSPLLSWRTKLRLPRVLLELWRHRRLLDPYHPERAAAIDREDLASYLRRTLGEEALEYVFGPAFASAFESEPEDLSAAFGLIALRLLGAGSELVSYEGGMGSLAQALAERVPVRCGCEVLAVETEGEGARVRYRAGGRERRALADAVVVALPGSLVPRRCPKLTPAERGFFERVSYSRGTQVFLRLERVPPPLSQSGVAFPRREGVGLYALAVERPSGEAGDGAALVSVALAEAESERLWGAPEAAVVEEVLERLAATPVGRLAPADAAVARWDPMLPRFGAGYARALAAFAGRLERSPRLAFAGDYLLGPYAEGAITSGLRAAGEVARALPR